MFLSAYAAKIVVNNILIVDNDRKEKPKLEICKSVDIYIAIMRALLPFFTLERIQLMDELTHRIMNMFNIRKLIPCNSIKQTSEFILYGSVYNEHR